MHETRKIVLLALFIALSIVLRGFESLIPNPFPWIRIGFANIMTLVAILLFGLKAGMLLTLLRVVIASLLFGTFLSPTFLISACAGICSTLVMGLTHRWWRSTFSPIGISVFGGFTHNLVQLFVAYALIVRHGEIFYLFPVLATIGVVSGAVNGWVGLQIYSYLCKHLKHLGTHPSREYDKKLA